MTSPLIFYKLIVESKKAPEFYELQVTSILVDRFIVFLNVLLLVG